MKYLFKIKQSILLAIFTLTLAGFFGGTVRAECSGDGSTQFKQAVESLKSAEEAVLGGARTILLSGWCATYSQWIAQLKKPPYSMQTEYSEGLTFPQAVTFLKKYIALPDPNNAQLRVNIINSAVYEVYGRKPTAIEQAFWDARLREQKATFLIIMTSEIGILNSSSPNQNPVASSRILMIERAFLASMGRSPSSAELKEMLPRTEHFRLIIEAKRKYLYPSAGADDYVKMLKNVIRYQYIIAKTQPMPANVKRDFFDEEAKKLMPIYSDQKLLFIQIIGEYGFEKYVEYLVKTEPSKLEKIS